MALLETLALTLGPTIAKSILKLWLKDSKIASDVSSGIVDIIAAKTKDTFAVQSGKRQFEAMGEKVAQSLQPMFESEGVDEASQEAVAHAVATTLGESQISVDLLLKLDLEPTELTKYLINTHPEATLPFSEAETQLYKHILDECSQYIVDIASQLPNFSERTFADVLVRESQLLKITQEILEEVRRMREPEIQLKHEEQGIKFETEYRRAVVRNLDRMELFGAELSNASKRHSLSVAYVTLSIQRRSLDAVGDTPPPGMKEFEDLEEDRLSRETQITESVTKALVERQRTLIYGQAGSGKTTLLKWIAVRAASKNFPKELSIWNDKVPFLIRLRHFIDRPFPAPEDFPGLVARSLAGTMPDGWVHEQLESGRAIALVDGVDEITHREEMRNWLADLIGAFPEIPFIVTTRPAAVQEGWLTKEGFDDVELQPMQLQDIYAFIEHWHRAVKLELQSDEQAEELHGLTENLKQIIRQNRAIRNLATNPLLCAMLCAMHRDRQRHLPADRIELYDACTQMLLERRDIERGIDLSSYPSLSYRQKLDLIKDLAYYLLRNGWSEVSIEDAEERLALQLDKMEGIVEHVTSSEVLQLFIERSGLVREPVIGKMDFTHRTFQEFLAAKEILDEGDIGILTSNATNDQWREVIILAAGLARPKEREKLIGDLIKQGDDEWTYRHHLHLLAVACLETSTSLEPESREELNRRLKDLMPPKNMTEAKALASAGDLAVRHLATYSQSYATVSAACVRALALIGSESALAALENYSSDTRITVVRELIKAWDYFDREEYAHRILVKQKLLTLELPSSEGIQYLTHLRGLKIGSEYSWAPIITDLNSFSQLTDLVFLDLHGIDQEVDLSPLAKLSNLQELNLTWSMQRVIFRSHSRQGTPDTDTEAEGNPLNLLPLGHLTNLTHLNLSNIEQVASFDPLAHLTNLSHLSLTILFNIIDLSALASLKNLVVLYLRWIESVTDLSPLSHLTNLNHLILSGARILTDLSPLADLTNLTLLELSGAEQITDLSPLSHLTHLTTLDLSGAKQVTDLSPLASLTHLTSLDLSGTAQISDLSPLVGLVANDPTDFEIHLNEEQRLRINLPETLSKYVRISHRFSRYVFIEEDSDYD